MIATHAVPMTSAADWAKCHTWVEPCFTSAATLPISSVFGEHTRIGIPDSWRSVTQQCRPDANSLLYSDDYPHTPYQRTAQASVAWQFDQPARGRGLLQAMRLPAAPQKQFTVHPQGIAPTATDCFENAEIGETRDISGQALHRDGCTATRPSRSGAIWFYLRTSR